MKYRYIGLCLILLGIADLNGWLIPNSKATVGKKRDSNKNKTANREPTGESTKNASIKKDLNSPNPLAQLPNQGDNPNILIRSVKTELEKYQQCMTDETCEGDESDSRSLNFSKGRELSEKIKDLNNELNQRPFKSIELSTLANQLLSVDDGYVKEEALKLMLSQDMQESNVESITEYVLDYHDGNLIPAALEELQRHLSGPNAPEIHSRLQNSLTTGSLLVRQALSEKLGPFINQGTYDFYDSLAHRPSVDSPIRRNLQAHLSEWKMHQSGG